MYCSSLWPFSTFIDRQRGQMCHKSLYCPHSALTSCLSHMCLILFVCILENRKEAEQLNPSAFPHVLKNCQVIVTWWTQNDRKYNATLKWKKCVCCFCGTFRDIFAVISTLWILFGTNRGKLFFGRFSHVALESQANLAWGWAVWLDQGLAAFTFKRDIFLNQNNCKTSVWRCKT